MIEMETERLRPCSSNAAAAHAVGNNGLVPNSQLISEDARQGWLLGRPSTPTVAAGPSMPGRTKTTTIGNRDSTEHPVPYPVRCITAPRPQPAAQTQDNPK